MITDKLFEEIFNKYFNKESLETGIFKKFLDKPAILLSDFSLFEGIQKITHSTLVSLDIKFGYFLEDLFNAILYSKDGVKQLDRNVKIDNKKFDYDSHFEYKGVNYILEIKKRDNHDSTKWKGQLENLIEKFNLSDNTKKRAIIYFIDSTYGVKNKNKYLQEWENYFNDINETPLDILYGEEIFDNEILDSDDWNSFKFYSNQASQKVREFVENMLTNTDVDKSDIDNFMNRAQEYIDERYNSTKTRKRYYDILNKIKDSV